MLGNISSEFTNAWPVATPSIFQWRDGDGGLDRTANLTAMCDDFVERESGSASRFERSSTSAFKLHRDRMEDVRSAACVSQ